MKRLSLILAAATLLAAAANSAASPAAKKFRILHVASYHLEWIWNQEQLEGFKDALKGLEVEYLLMELDTKRQSDQAAIAAKADKVIAKIEEWRPDLVYTNDDHAQNYVTRKYVGKALPFVFSAVNQPPQHYGFVGANNITGVAEQEHFAATVELLRRLVPSVRRMAVVIDRDPTWEGVVERIKESLAQIPDLEIADWATIETFAEYQEKMRGYQDSVDAVATLGVFNFKDENGKEVDYERVLRWTVENSRLPDISFWDTRVERGTLCAVTVSGYQQGYLAGEMARRILVDGVSPKDIPIRPTIKGTPVISLARARQLGLKPDANLLLTADVKTKYTWE